MQTELFIQFQRAHTDIIIQQRSFEKLKPYFVRKLKDRNTCCCIQHVQISFLRDAVHQIRQTTTKFHGRSCFCTCKICNADVDASVGCVATTLLKSSITKTWENVLCAKAEKDAFHALPCLMGTCNKCSAEKLECCPRELVETSKSVTVKIFEDIEVGINRKGKKQRRKVLTFKEMSYSDVLRDFKTYLQKFIRHNFISRWQAEQFKQSVQTFPEHVVVSVIDFAENYTFQEQNEIQSMHWHSNQITILVHITYIHIAGEVQKYLHFYISDDKTHDTLFVQHCFMIHYSWLKEQGLTSLSEHWVWSDGAASQFKAKKTILLCGQV